MGDLAPLSPANARVKRAAELRRRSARTERRLFLAEGVNAVEAALAADCLVEVFATAEGAARIAERLADERLDVTLVDDRGMRKLSDAVTPPGAIAVCRLPVEIGLEERLDQVGLDQPVRLVVCVEPRDPGNLGTIIRTAEAAGATAVPRRGCQRA